MVLIHFTLISRARQSRAEVTKGLRRLFLSLVGVNVDSVDVINLERTLGQSFAVIIRWQSRRVMKWTEMSCFTTIKTGQKCCQDSCCNHVNTFIIIHHFMMTNCLLDFIEVLWKSKSKMTIKYFLCNLYPHNNARPLVSHTYVAICWNISFILFS